MRRSLGIERRVSSWLRRFCRVEFLVGCVSVKGFV